MTLRNAFEALSTESTLAAIRDEQLRRTDPVLTSSVLNRKAAEGKVFIAGKAITAGGALSTARPAFRIANPVSSGKTLQVFLLSLYSNVGQQIRFREGASLSPATAITPRQWNPTLQVASAAVVQWSDAAPTGGTLMNNESRIYNTSPLPIAFPVPYIILPGQSFTIDFESSASQITTANAYWYEEPI